MSAIFTPKPWAVDRLVGGVEDGTISLPDLQRPFVWSASKVRDLFDSMYRGYPVGELMFWDVPGDGDSRSIGGAVRQAAQHQIIDGQQRLTSLYAAIKGTAVRDEAYRSKSITISFQPFTGKFEVRNKAIGRSPLWVADVSTVFGAAIQARRAFIERYRASGQDMSDEDEEKVEVALGRLDALRNYQFQVVHLERDAPKAIVADIFVRINSEGVSLKAADFILTWLSVFWPDGREAIEMFARRSRITPARASEIEGRRVDWTAMNPFLALETGHVVRAMVAVGQRRARLQDAYAALQAKDRTTGMVDEQRMTLELDRLRRALPVVTDRVNWTEFIRSVQQAGFRSGKGITSTMNLVASYVVFLLGRDRARVELARLRTLIAQWVFMSQMTSRYTGSSESQLQKDLDSFGELAEGDAAGFEAVVRQTIETTLTNDFWELTVPQLLVSSNGALSPIYQCYLAALNTLDAEMFMLDMRVREWMDPSLPVVKGLEGHHLFPRKYQERELHITDTKRINQVANFAPTDWATNIGISDDSPSVYWPRLIESRTRGQAWLDRQRYWHALPEDWEHMEYEQFLNARRRLMAGVIRDGFEALDESSTVPAAVSAAAPETSDEAVLTLSDLVSAGILTAGDLLDPVDPSWVVDAVVTDDGTLMIDGTEEYDTLDAAAHALGVTNLPGIEFWALETTDGLAPLTDLLESATA